MKKYNVEEYFNNNINSEEFILISHTDILRGPAKIKHVKCGYEFNTTNLYAWIYNGKVRICPLCAENTNMFSLDLIQRKLNKLYPEKYIVIDTRDKFKYFKTKDKFLIKDNTCGHEFMACWDRLKQGNGCPKCGLYHGSINNKNRLTPEKLKKRLSDIEYKDYGFLNLDEFQTVHIKNMRVKHKSCGTEFITRMRNILYNKNLCPLCSSESRIEVNIKNTLHEKKFSDFIYQKEFDDLFGSTGKKKLLFDFLIKDTLLELNGEFHYRNNRTSEINKEIERQEKNDKLKIEYVKRNKLNFIVIPFWEFKNYKKILNILLESSTTNKKLLKYNITVIKDGEVLKELVEPEANADSKCEE